jgi:hypothetical protein
MIPSRTTASVTRNRDIHLHKCIEGRCSTSAYKSDQTRWREKVKTQLVKPQPPSQEHNTEEGDE